MQKTYQEFLDGDGKEGGEEKWQKYWDENKTFKAKEPAHCHSELVSESQETLKQVQGDIGEKFYGLVEFPYPSGAGLHVGHPRPYTAMDVISRKKRMEGKNVLFPIGFDAFGLPTENYAIKTGRAPQDVTKENIANFTRQIKSLGFSFDWDRTVDTTDPEYFKWTQWLFLKFFENGLAYKKEMPINWCLNCKIGLANEEVVDGKCERCGGEVVKKNKSQWMLAITKYADKLLKGLENVDYIPQAKAQQENWIGKSEGASVRFTVVDCHSEQSHCHSELVSESQETLKQVQGDSDVIPAKAGVLELEVFTTRPDTLFGATYMVVAPEHELIKNLESKIENLEEVKEYIKKASLKSDLERTELQKDKSGVELIGLKAINPVNGNEIPIFVADYVLISYGAGAIMAVPAHDERDNKFAKKYGLEIKEVVKNDTPHCHSEQSHCHSELVSESQETLKRVQGDSDKSYFAGEGVSVNSDFLNGLKTKEAKSKMIEWLEEKNIGKREINYKLRDWVFSRQRYWGEPIPLVDCKKCGWVPLSEKDLPLELPKVDNYVPTDTGESPLSAIDDWVNTTCPKCGGEAKRETDTMPNWAGSSWYFLRYMDPDNKKEFASQDKLKYWGPIDWYNGGMEHTVLHLLYSRFWNIFLHDIGLVSFSEPYKKRTSHGMILAGDGEKMSKSRGNVINPDEMVEKFGADALRTYIMFMGPFDQAVAWSTDGLKGVRRFLDKVWNLQEKCSKEDGTLSPPFEGVVAEGRGGKMEGLMHKTIKKVGEDIEEMRFNTAISSLMIWVNELVKHEKIGIDEMTNLSLLLSPFAPHMAEELWKKLGNKESITKAEWPNYDEAKIKDETITLAVQVNGKLRDTLEVDVEISDIDAKEKALESEKIQKWLEGKEPKKVIYVKGKLISIVV